MKSIHKKWYSLEEFLYSIPNREITITLNTIKYSIANTNIVVNYACFKCLTSGEYLQILKLFRNLPTCKIYEDLNVGKEGSKRPVSIIKLPEQVREKLGYMVQYIELCDQKPDNSQIGDWDHIGIICNIKAKEIINIMKEENTVFDINFSKLELKLYQYISFRVKDASIGEKMM